MVIVKCLGSGDAFGAGGRMNTGYLVSAEGVGILIDCGATTSVALRKYGHSIDDVDYILISHLHGDHFGGLVFILCEILALGRRRKPLTIAGPPGVKEKALTALECFYPGFKIGDDSIIRFRVYDTGVPMSMDAFSFKALPVVHAEDVNPHGLRIEIGGCVIAYSGDTAWTDTLLALSENADLFICEASTFSTRVKGHLSVEEIVDRKDRIRAHRIVLTHLSDEALERLDEIPFSVAADGQVIFNSAPTTA